MRSNKLASAAAAAAITVAVIACLTVRPAAAETREWAVNWFTQAAYSQDNDCPGGINPSIDDVYRRILKEQMGKSPEEIETIFKGFNGGLSAGPVQEMFVNRGRIDGKPVSAYGNPTSVPDDHMVTVVGRYAYGFNLDGKGADSPNSFEDPETHERGINNQYFRAVGCIKSHRAYPPERSTFWTYSWDGVRDSMPAWLISITGDDLKKDGDVTVTFDRALKHALKDASGDIRPDTTFRTDPDPRSHNVFRGKMKDGTITIEPADFRMVGDPFVFPMFDFKQLHLRLKMKPDGTLDGTMGGYQPWMDLYFYYASQGYPIEAMISVDIPGVFYTLRRLADAYPDPATGQNMRMSTAYRIEAVPAFIVRQSEPSKTAQAGQ